MSNESSVKYGLKTGVNNTGKIIVNHSENPTDKFNGKELYQAMMVVPSNVEVSDVEGIKPVENGNFNYIHVSWYTKDYLMNHCKMGECVDNCNDGKVYEFSTNMLDEILKEKNVYFNRTRKGDEDYQPAFAQGVNKKTNSRHLKFLKMKKVNKPSDTTIPKTGNLYEVDNNTISVVNGLLHLNGSLNINGLVVGLPAGN